MNVQYMGLFLKKITGSKTCNKFKEKGIDKIKWCWAKNKTMLTRHQGVFIEGGGWANKFLKHFRNLLTLYNNCDTIKITKARRFFI